MKQGFIYLALSVIIVAFAQYAHLLVLYLDILYTYTHLELSPFFSTTRAGIILRGVITLTLLPILITAIPALAYRAVKGKMMPYYYEATWFIWLMIVVSKIIII